MLKFEDPPSSACYLKEQSRTVVLLRTLRQPVKRHVKLVMNNLDPTKEDVTLIGEALR